MDLFNNSSNLLPYDGLVRNMGCIYSKKEAQSILETLQNEIRWQEEELQMFGKKIKMRRKVAWYSDRNFTYRYSGVDKTGHLWTPLLKQLKDQVENLSGAQFNSCLLNYYLDGQDGMGWHSDNEKSLVKDACIASLSFGAERIFKLKHKQTKEVVNIPLESGQLILMEKQTQEFWKHSIPKSKKIHKPRINLTFRKYLI